MPAVETVLVPSGGFWGGVRRAAGAAFGAGAVQRDFCGHRQARPLAAAEGPGPEGVAVMRRPDEGGLREEAVWFALGGLLIAAGSCCAAAAPPPGASSCSGCHATNAGRRPGAADPRPRSGGDRRGDAGLSRRRAASTVMGRIAKGFSDDEIRAIAAWRAQRTERRHDPRDATRFPRAPRPAAARACRGRHSRRQAAGRRRWRRLCAARPAPGCSSGAEPRFEVTLVEPSRTFTACPFSNEVIAGLRDISAQHFNYDARAARGSRSSSPADGVDPQARRSLGERHISIMTGWFWRRASRSAGMPCPATTRRQPRACRMPGGPANRPCCCAASSRPCPTADWS